MSIPSLWITKMRKTSKFLLIFILITGWIFSGWPQIFNFPPKIQQARAATAGPSFPTSGVNDSSIGATAWTTPGNVTATDNTRANVSLAKNSGVSQAIKATGFGFAIPADAEINGITVEWETSEGGLAAAGGIKDNAVRIVKAGTIGATDNSNTTFWVAPASEAFVSYGGVADLWGEVWTATDINSANFGAAISAKNVKVSGGGANEDADVDSVRITITYTLPTYNQSAYRAFNNLDSTDVGTTLAAQDTAATLGSTGAAFRLRMLLHIGAAQLGVSAQNFKLQFAQQSGTCDTAFVGETYADVTAATVIAYNDNLTPADGATLTANASDPTHGADTIVNQTYEELNNFTNSVAAIPSAQDGKWDFSLKDNGATASTAYCLRAVKSDATVLNTYTVIPQITTAAASSLTFVVSTDNFSTLTPGSPVFATSTLSVDTNNSTGWNVTASRDDADTTMDLDTDATVNITDQTAWVPGAATTTAGNAARISSLINSGDVLAMRVMTASGTVSFISTAWWGTTDSYIDSATTLWAGFNSTAQKIGDSSVSSGGSAKLNTVLYYLDVPSTQRTGAYSGGITYTATMNP